MADPRSNPSHSSSAEWERLSTLFEAAQSLPPESREQYLDAVCQANPALRAELDALLASSHEAPAFLRSTLLRRSLSASCRRNPTRTRAIA
jgi:hypothetical protein